MTQYAKPESVQANFDGVVLYQENQEYRLKRVGDEYWVELPDPDWMARWHEANGMKALKAGEAPRITTRIGLLTGSHHMQMFWIPAGPGNRQTIFAFAWLNEDKRWVPLESTFLRDPKIPPASQSWNVNCLKCHTTGGQPMVDPAAGSITTRVGEMGIACEACHGPGEEHVRKFSSPLLRYAMHGAQSGEFQVAHPTKLKKPMASQVCGQCHGIKWVPAAEKSDLEGFRYRPGDDMEQTTPIIQPAHLEDKPWLAETLGKAPGFLEDHYWRDGEVRVSGRDYNGMIDSPCYLKGELSCFSCHSIHTSAPENQLDPRWGRNEACLQCHTKLRENISAHTHHAASSTGSECYNCHMPYTTYGLLKGIRSHRITVPSVSVTVATGRPNACNLCHLDRTLEWTGQRLNEWYHKVPPQLSEERKQISAAVLWLLKGDAGQRALVAHSAGWKAAQEASGAEWLAPFLAERLDDPYPAVRYIAGKALRSLPGFGEFSYDHVGEAGTLVEAKHRALSTWELQKVPGTKLPGAAVLMNEGGQLDRETLGRLSGGRDDHSMDLQE